MKFGFVIPGAAPRDQVSAAVAAEEAGWDGVFVFEGPYSADAWSVLAAMAVLTDRVHLGTMLTRCPGGDRGRWRAR